MILTDNRSLFVATRVKKQTKNKVKDLTSKLGTRMETGRLRRDLLGLVYTLKSRLLGLDSPPLMPACIYHGLLIHI